jgi:hypothetical protein
MADADGRGLVPAAGTGRSGAAACLGRARRAEAAGVAGLLPMRAVPRVAAAAVVTFWRVVVPELFTGIMTQYPVRGG